MPTGVGGCCSQILWVCGRRLTSLMPRSSVLTLAVAGSVLTLAVAEYMGDCCQPGKRGLSLC